ncbi:hypothetical protein [Pseudomonas sp.]|uniref:hypothetical protein n=1 Tax=Pseudomonas sp. TaxID=306 RepID=UPI0032426861
MVVVGPVGVAVEVAQVGGQLAVTQREIVHCAQVVLAVVILQLGEVVGRSQVVGQRVVTAGVAEAVNALSATGYAQVVVVAGNTAAGLADFTEGQRQAVDIAGGQLSAAEGLWQQAAVVVGQYRQFGLQYALAVIFQ